MKKPEIIAIRKTSTQPTNQATARPAKPAEQQQATARPDQTATQQQAAGKAKGKQGKAKGVSQGKPKSKGSGKAGSNPPQKQSGFQQPQNQSLALLSGCLGASEGKLFLLCSGLEAIRIPIASIDQRLSVWLLAHPNLIFSSEPAHWICYPKSPDRSPNLSLFLKGRRDPDSPDHFPLQVDQARVKGKLLARDGDRLTIGIRRNLSPQALSELYKKQMLRGSEFDQFTVTVWGQIEAEVGGFVELQCERVGDRLTVTEGSAQTSIVRNS